jgi:hypothetical protein
MVEIPFSSFATPPHMKPLGIGFMDTFDRIHELPSNGFEALQRKVAAAKLANARP